MKRYLLVLSASIIAILLSMPASACVKVAYSRTTGEYGVGTEYYGCTSSSGDSALYKCAKSDCQIELTVRLECGSLARQVDDTQFIVSSKADNRNDAGNKALAACGSNCQLITTVCDSD